MHTWPKFQVGSDLSRAWRILANTDTAAERWFFCPLLECRARRQTLLKKWKAGQILPEDNAWFYYALISYRFRHVLRRLNQRQLFRLFKFCGLSREHIERLMHHGFRTAEEKDCTREFQRGLPDGKRPCLVIEGPDFEAEKRVLDYLDQPGLWRGKHRLSRAWNRHVWENESLNALEKSLLFCFILQRDKGELKHYLALRCVLRFLTVFERCDCNFLRAYSSYQLTVFRHVHKTPLVQRALSLIENIFSHRFDPLLEKTLALLQANQIQERRDRS